MKPLPFIKFNLFFCFHKHVCWTLSEIIRELSTCKACCLLLENFFLHTLPFQFIISFSFYHFFEIPRYIWFEEISKCPPPFILTPLFIRHLRVEKILACRLKYSSIWTHFTDNPEPVTMNTNFIWKNIYIHMTHRVFNMQKTKSIIDIQWHHEDNPMRPSSSSPQWLCGDMPAMDGQWRSSRIASVRANRVLNKH